MQGYLQNIDVLSWYLMWQYALDMLYKGPFCSYGSGTLTVKFHKAKAFTTNQVICQACNM